MLDRCVASLLAVPMRRATAQTGGDAEKTQLAWTLQDIGPTAGGSALITASPQPRAWSVAPSSGEIVELQVTFGF